MAGSSPFLDSLCRNCGASPPGACGSRRIVRHPELFRLRIAHVDCDAFYPAGKTRARFGDGVIGRAGAGERPRDAAR